MKKTIKITILVLLSFGILVWAGLALSNLDIAVLNPKGLIAMKERSLLITASLLMLIVVVPVWFLTVFFAWKYRSSHTKSKYTPDWAHSHLAESLWWGIPLVIIVILAIMTWTSSHELDPYKPIESDKKPIEIQVVALQWKWLFIYPEHGIATVNFIQFPEKRPVHFEITADAPMNSFWIPQLGGQIYAMSSMRSHLHLIANEVGIFKGVSANFSGKGFAGMTFTAKASSEEEFNQWVKSVKKSSPRLNEAVYQHLAMPSENNPVTSYILTQQDLFDRILMKYQAPSRQE